MVANLFLDGFCQVNAVIFVAIVENYILKLAA